jgi:hypothetical protein
VPRSSSAASSEEEREAERERQRSERDEAHARVERLPEDLSGLSDGDLSRAVVDARTALRDLEPRATALEARIAKVLDDRSGTDAADDDVASDGVAEAA